MVKANAYGHGVREIAECLKNEDVTLGVATLDEAIALRRVWEGQILIVEPQRQIDLIKNGNFLFAVDELSAFEEVIQHDLTTNCYIKINTGMNRFGIKYDDRVLKKFARLAKKHHVRGLMTHFSNLEDEKFSKLQYDRFQKVKKMFPKDIVVSFGGSMVVESGFECDEVRVGLGFYGYGQRVLLPIMEIKSEVLKVLSLCEGEGLGYGNAFVAKNKTKIAVVGLGYGDGIRRDLSGFFVLVNGKRCRIVGNICMDCLFVDVTSVFCQQGDEVCFEDADKVSDFLKTIPYEVLTACSHIRCAVCIY